MVSYGFSTVDHGGKPQALIVFTVPRHQLEICKGVGTDRVAAAWDITDVLCITETRERSTLFLASARAAGHAVTLAESRKTSAFLNRRE
jgi:hypothetical protein